MLNNSVVEHNPFSENEIIKVGLINDAQKEIWLACVIGGDEASLSYNESISLQFDGDFELEHFRESLQQLCTRHEAFRSTISNDGETFLVYRKSSFILKEFHFIKLNEIDQKKALKEFIDRESNLVFDLNKEPLFRVYLHHLSANKYLFTIFIHHIISDGWSLGVIIDELSELYNAALKNTEKSLAIPHQISEYSLEELSFKNSSKFRDIKKYWSNKIDVDFFQIELPHDFTRIHPRTYKSERIDFDIEDDTLIKLKRLANSLQISLVSILLSSFEIFIKKITNNTKTLIGLPAAGQLVSGHYNLIGHCVNFLPIFSHLQKHETSIQYALRRKNELINDLDHQQITLVELLKGLDIKRTPNNKPIISIIFNVDMGMDKGVKFIGLQHQLISNPRSFEHADLFLNLTGNEDKMVFEWQYNQDIWDSNTIFKFNKLFLVEIENLIHYPNKKIKLRDSTLQSHVSESVEKNINVNKSNGLVNKFEKVVNQSPDAIAVQFEGIQLTYKRFNESINQLARQFSNRGIVSGDKVVLTTDRSAEVIMAMMALIKIGAISIPIDSKYPKDRIDLIINNIAPSMILSSRILGNSKITEKLNDYFIEDLIKESNNNSTENFNFEYSENRPIYILHTSGSTGIPKAVIMCEDALLNLFIWQVSTSAVNSKHSTLQYSALNFDVSFQEIFATWFTGGKLVLISDITRLDPSLLLSYLLDNNINRIYFPFVAMQSLVEYANSINLYPASLIEVITAGEQLKITPQVRDFFNNLPNCRLFNHYGPTETHVVTSLKLDGNPNEWPALPSIGKEIQNTEHYILDVNQSLLPTGESGELYLGGICLAKGYFNNEELTKKTFIYWQHPKKGEIRIYKSGDLARRLINGNIEFLGRIDQQVKIRGYRVELSEIEYYLSQIPSIKQAIVVARENSEKDQVRLLAYVQTNDDRVNNDVEHTWKERWDLMYNDAHTELKNNSSNSLDSIVFRTLARFEDAEMHEGEWLQETLLRLRKTIDRNLNKNNYKIYEIGCGGGQLLFALSHSCTKYYASDISEIPIQHIQDKKNKSTLFNNLHLKSCDANDFSLLGDDKVDLIIINSVSQYFPTINYLTDLITNSTNYLKKDGCIFIGDVQAKETQNMCLVSEQFEKITKNITIAEFKKITEKRIQADDELVIDPSYFYHTILNMPEVAHVEVQLRKGDFINETTKYHYDVWIYTDFSITYSKPDHSLNWQDLSSPDVLVNRLNDSRKSSFHVHSIQNARCIKDMKLIETLNVLKDTEVLSSIQFEESTADAKAYHPDFFWEIGEHYNFTTYVRWMNSGVDNLMEVFFIPENEMVGACPPLSVGENCESADRMLAVQVLQNDIIKSNFPSWIEFLKTKLPEYMIPDQIIVIDHIPLTSTGKVNRKELPIVEFDYINRSNVLIEPKNEVEAFLVNTWTKLLSSNNVSTNVDFFEIGGHSLLAVKVVIAIEKKYKIKIPLTAFFDYSTIAEFALLINEKLNALKQIEIENLNTLKESIARNNQLNSTKDRWNALVPIKRTGSMLPIYMIHGAGLNVLVFKSFVRYMDVKQPVYGIQALGQNGYSKSVSDIFKIAQLYVDDILKNDPDGPYILGGYSYGGFLAYEMTRILISLGKEVKMLAIFDTSSNKEGVINTTTKEAIKKVMFHFNTILKTPKRYFSHQLLLTQIKIKSIFKKNTIANVEAFSFDHEIIKNYREAFEKFELIPQDIELHLFKAKNSLAYYSDTEYMGWKEYVKKVHTYDIPGDHKTIFFPPHDKVLASVLQEALTDINQIDQLSNNE